MATPENHSGSAPVSENPFDICRHMGEFTFQASAELLHKPSICFLLQLLPHLTPPHGRLVLAWYLKGIYPSEDPKEALCSRSSFSLKKCGVCPQSSMSFQIKPVVPFLSTMLRFFLSLCISHSRVFPEGSRTLGRCFPHLQISQFSFWVSVTDSCPSRKWDTWF